MGHGHVLAINTSGLENDADGATYLDDAVNQIQGLSPSRTPRLLPANLSGAPDSASGAWELQAIFY
jgi:hypothetical protein